MSALERRGSHYKTLALAAAVSLVSAAVGYAATHHTPRAEAPRTASGSPYVPSISDLMIETIQPRHERLWQAEQERNWDFAAYELGNLHGAFDRLGRAHPTTHEMSLPDMIASVTDQPIKALESAIRAKDDAAFVKAYAGLTGACNACHQALGHGVVAIRVPREALVSDLFPRGASAN